MSDNTSAGRLPKPSLPRRIFGTLLLLITAAASAYAQSDAAGTTPSGLTPGAPAGSYALSGFENVNLFNGNLNFHLPLVGVGGRGVARHTATLKVDQTWTVLTEVNDRTGAYTYVPEPNWWEGIRPGYGPGVLQARHGASGSLRCGNSLTGFYNVATKTLTRLTFTASDGTEFELRDSKTGGRPQPKDCSNSDTEYNRGRVFVTADGSSATFLSDADVTDRARFPGQEGLVTRHSGYLLMRDGTRYRIDDGTVAWIRDRNGNLISFEYDASKRVTSITDSPGRRVTIDYDQAEGAPYGTCDLIRFNGFGGASRVLRVCKASLGNALRATRQADVTAPQTFKVLFPELDGSNSTDYDPTVVGSIWLPDGQRRYQLFYNQYGELARVVLPTGGAIEYDYAGGFVGGPDSGAFGPARNRHIYRRVVERRVYPSGADLNNFESRTSYSRPESISSNVLLSSAGYVTVEQFDRDGSRETYEQHYFNGTAYDSFFISAVHYPSWLDGREYKTEVFDSAGAAVLNRVERSWRQRAAVAWWDSTQGPEPQNDPRLVTTVTTLEPGGSNLVAKTTSVDPADPTGQTVGFDRFNNQTDVWEYDYGAGSAPQFPVRHTHTDYVADANYVNADENPAAGASLRELPRARQVYSVNPDTGAETAAARGETRYDEAAYPLVTYDGVTVPGWSDPATATRGNATSVRSFVNASVAVAPGDPCPAGVCVETHAQYDQLGNVRYSWDANGNLSQVSYLDSFCNGGSGCGGGFAAHTFAFPTLTKTPKPDPSGTYASAAELTTSTVYDYYTGLVYSMTDPNLQTTRYEYESQPAQLDRLKAVVRPDTSRTDISYGDAVGDLYVRVLTDLDGARRTEAVQYFDGLGRVYRRATKDGSDPSKPWLNEDTEFDALGRVVRASMPYRSAGGGAPLSQDEWSNVKRLETDYDALGRVRNVTTRPDGARVRTDYDGNRVLVTDQADRQRISRTDALGRLTEVWEVTPSDASGYPGIESVSFPVQAGVPQPAAGYRTSYFYDATGNLRRVQQGTQARFFAYDSLGRLLRARNPEQGYFTPDAAGGDFPAMTDATSGVSNSQWSTGYLYDAAGNLWKRKDARGVVTTYGYDALNRNTSVDYSDSTPDVTRSYDGAATGKGRPWKSESAQTALTTVGEYDEAGRPLRQSRQFQAGGGWGEPFTSVYAYDLAGNLKSLTYPSGHAVSYAYDAAGRLSDFTGNLGDGAARTYAAGIAYDDSGRMSQERYGTDTPVYNKHFFNGRGQLAEIRLSTYGLDAAGQETSWDRGAIINHYSSSGWGASGGGSDNNGNLRRQEVFIPKFEGQGYDQAGNFDLFTQDYEYDALNRLTRVGESTGGAERWAQKYEYDRWGNRTIDHVATWNAPQPQFTVDTNTNRLGVPSGQAGQMDYDAAGNLTLDTYQGGQPGGGTRTYDAENRMTSAQFVSGQQQIATYTYDADGRRVRMKFGAGGEVWQVYGLGGELLAEYAAGASATSPQKEYGYRGGELLVTASATTGAAQAGAEAVAWTNVVGAAASGSTLTKTAASGWGNSGAVSTKAITSGDGYVEFTATQAQVERVCGLSRGDTDQGHADVDFGILLSDGGYVYAWESGVQKVNAGPYSVGDRLRVAVEGGVVRYYRNGVLFYTSAATPSYPLLADAAINSAGASVGSAVISGSLTAVEGVRWTNEGGVSVSGSTITKTAAAGWGNAGASSAQSIASGDGYVEFTAAETGVERVCGLSRGDSSRSHEDVDFGILLSDGGYVYAWESGVQKANAGPYSVGDRLRVAVDGGRVKYYRNGVLFYTSSAAPTYPLLVDTALYNTNSTVSSAVISGSLASAAAAAWVNTAGVTVSGGTLTKTAATGWGNAGATSSQTVASGGAYVEFTATADRTDRVCGLGRTESARNITDIEYGIELSDGGYAYAVEGGAVKANGGAYSTGDRLRVSVEGGAVRYYRNGSLFYTSTAAPAYPLRAEAALNQQGAAVGDVTLWGAGVGSGGGEVRWLVSDQLGTPRMIVDRTGSLAGVTRHDYLPFGEELSAGAGGRTTVQGYSVADNVRQKFTKKERDNETMLDYFGARYYSSSAGRFISIDPILSSGRVNNPQTWNRYVYTLNNPIKFTDPDGLYEFDSSVDKTQRENFRQLLKQVNDQVNKIKKLYGEKSEEYKQAQAGLKAYGCEAGSKGCSEKVGESRVVISAGTLRAGVGAQESRIDNGTRTQVTLDAKLLTIGSPGLIFDIAHEGVHVNDDLNYIDRNVSVTDYDSEFRAYVVTSVMYEVFPSSYASQKFRDGTDAPIWDEAWTKVDKRVIENVRNKRKEAIDAILAYPKDKGGYGLTPSSPGYTYFPTKQ